MSKKLTPSGLMDRISASTMSVPETSFAAPTRSIEDVEQTIERCRDAIGYNLITIGVALIDAKELLAHGEWLPWLEERAGFSERKAQELMSIARGYESNPRAGADLGAKKALALLSLEPEARQEFVDAVHEVGGEHKTVADMSTRELKALLKQRKAEEKAEQLELEHVADEMMGAVESVVPDTLCFPPPIPGCAVDIINGWLNHLSWCADELENLFYEYLRGNRYDLTTFFRKAYNEMVAELTDKLPPPTPREEAWLEHNGVQVEMEDDDFE